MRRDDLIGQRFGDLVVTAFHDVIETPGGTRRTRWLCCCACGADYVVRGRDLKAGATKRCDECRAKVLDAGLYRLRHGQGRTRHISREYRAWQEAKKRCENPNATGYSAYGGRGIRMCVEWAADFVTFVHDMGPCPDGYELDRIDSDGHYEPGNCRWASEEVQQNNRRSNHYLDMADGSTMTLTQYARFMGVSPRLFQERLTAGWSIGEAICAPLGARRRAA